MGTTLWTDPQTDIEERIEDDNPIYSIVGGSAHALSLLADGQPATAVLDDLVEYFDTLDAGIAVVGTDANGVWPAIELFADVVTAARVVADQHRIGTVSPAAYQGLADATATFDRSMAAHASHDA
jgi:hypothetical protein